MTTDPDLHTEIPRAVDMLTAAGVILLDLIEVNEEVHANHSWRLALDLIGERINELVLSYYHNYAELISKSPIDMEFEEISAEEGAEKLLYELRHIQTEFDIIIGVGISDIISLLQDGLNSIILTRRSNTASGVLRSPWDVLKYG